MRIKRRVMKLLASAPCLVHTSVCFTPVTQRIRTNHPEIRGGLLVVRHLVGLEHSEMRTDVITPDYPHELNQLELWYMTKMETWYKESLALKCPFMRRRMSDFLDAVDMAMRFLLIRNESLEVIGPPFGLRRAGNVAKNMGLPLEELACIIRKDWREDNNKGYYITGRLNTSVYRDDCLFDGPDPDLPVRGLRKYLNAASQLFEYQTSSAQLNSLEIVGDVIQAKWCLDLTLRLPWKPTLPECTGTTTYHFDEDGLVYLHQETWDMSVFQAFMRTFMPEVAQKIWPHYECIQHKG